MRVRDAVRTAEVMEIHEIDAAIARAALPSDVLPPSAKPTFFVGCREYATALIGLPLTTFGLLLLMGLLTGAFPAGVAIIALVLLVPGVAMLISVISAQRRRRAAVAAFESGRREHARRVEELPTRRVEAVRRAQERLREWAAATGDDAFAASVEQLTGALPSP